MQTIQLDRIQVLEHRQRRIFDEGDINLLAQDIAHSHHGLLHPIILREGDSGEAILISGERRLRAIRDLHSLGLSFTHGGQPVPPGEAPVIFLGNLDKLSAEEAEFAENEIRAQLTWQERALANARLKELRDAQAIKAGKAPITTREFAGEVRKSSLGTSYEYTRKELIVSNYLDDPEVQAAKGIQEAFKILQKKEVKQKMRDLSVSVGLTHTFQHQCLCRDSLEWIAGVPDESYDIILTDPPYGMNAHEFKDSGAGIPHHSYEDSEETFTQNILPILRHTWRIAKPEAHLYIFCDPERFWQLRDEMRQLGWRVFRTPLIWAKASGFRAPWPQHGPQRKYEMIVYAIKGDRKINSSYGDVLVYNIENNLDHGAQKPLGLYKELLSHSGRPGDTVLDPFCGTGTIFPAADALQLVATGVERDETSHGIALNRLLGLKKEPANETR